MASPHSGVGSTDVRVSPAGSADQAHTWAPVWSLASTGEPRRLSEIFEGSVDLRCVTGACSREPIWGFDAAICAAGLGRRG